MKVFVLTQTEGRVTTPVATTVSEKKARTWFAQATGNDFFPMVLDQLDHLGFPENEEQFEAPPADLSIPEMPAIDTQEPAEAFMSISRYLESLAESIETLQEVVLT